MPDGAIRESRGGGNASGRGVRRQNENHRSPGRRILIASTERSAFRYFFRFFGRDDVPAIGFRCDTVLWRHGCAELYVVGDTADELREVGGVRGGAVDGGL